MKTAIQFGAGNIGRGFIAQLFYESGLETVFVDVAQTMVDELNARGEYHIHIVGENPAEVAVRNVRAIVGTDVPLVAEAIAKCDLLCTAVGAGVLKHIAPTIAQGLILRHRRSGENLNILLCENLHDAGTHLRNEVARYLPSELAETILRSTGFVQAVVSRMVPLQTAKENGGDVLTIRVEAYKKLPIDATSLVPGFPQIAGVIPVNNFVAQVERKLYAHNCAHAALGYAGFHLGITYAWEAIMSSQIREQIDEVMRETGEALIKRHGFDRAEHAEHVAGLLHRFENRALGDTCFRLARDPVRKLAFDDRLVGAARLCELEGIEPRALAKVIALAFRFQSSGDPVSMSLAEMIAQQGVEATLLKVSGVHWESNLGKLILSAYATGSIA